MANYNAIKYDGFSKGSTTLIKTLTASSSATLSFVDGTSDVVLDNTYKEYLFIFNNIHPATDEADFQFQGNVAGGSGYNETITSTVFKSGHDEGDTSGQAKIQYESDSDQAQGTAFQTLGIFSGADNDQCTSGYLHLFNPSSTTFVKHFIGVNQISNHSDTSAQEFYAGYCNVTAAIDGVQFSTSAGTFETGRIALYGIK